MAKRIQANTKKQQKKMPTRAAGKPWGVVIAVLLFLMLVSYLYYFLIQ